MKTIAIYIVVFAAILVSVLAVFGPPQRQENQQYDFDNAIPAIAGIIGQM